MKTIKIIIKRQSPKYRNNSEVEKIFYICLMYWCNIFYAAHVDSIERNRNSHMAILIYLNN